MKLEIIIALVLGLILGLGGMMGIVLITKSVKTHKAEVVVQSPTPQANKTNVFKVDSPLINTVSGKNTLLIKGTTPNSDSIILSGMSNDTFVKNTNNTFEGEVSLDKGINKIRVTNLTSLQTINLTVLNISLVPDNKTYTQGVVTDITEENIQIRQDNGSIGQIKITKDSKAATISKETKAIDMKDVAIGDVVIAVLEDDENMTATNIVVNNGETQFPDAKVVSGTFDNFDKTTVTLSTGDEKNTVIYGRSTKLVSINEDGSIRARTRFINSDTGSKVYAVNTTGADKAARTIFLLPVASK